MKQNRTKSSTNATVDEQKTPKAKKVQEQKIDPETLPVWDLSPFYKGEPDYENNPYIQKDFAEVSRTTADLLDLRDTVKNMDVDEITKLIKDYSKIVCIIQKLNGYAHLNLSEDRKRPQVIKLHDKVRTLTKQTFDKLSWIHHELYHLPEETKLQCWFSEDNENFKYFNNWLIGVLFVEPSLSILQQIAVNTISSLSDGWLNLYMDTLAHASFKVGKKNYEYNEVLELLYDSNPKIALEARKSLYTVLNQYKRTFAATLNNLYDIENATTHLEMRDDYGKLSIDVNGLQLNCMANGLLDSHNIQPMIMAIQGYGYDISRKFYSILAKIQGVDKLSYYDRLKNPLDEGKNFYPWETAKDLLLALLATFHNTYYDVFDDEERASLGEDAYAILQENLIHVRPMPNKEPGAYAHHGKLLALFMDKYDGSLKSLLTFFHEMGHMIHHRILNRYFGTLTCDCTIPKAEIASLFMELMLMKALLANSDLTNRQRLYYLIELAQHLIASIQRQCAFHLFERSVFEEKRKGSVSAERMNEIYKREMEKYLGFDLHEEEQNGWMTISHFFGSPFYVQFYSVSGLIVNKLWKIYESSTLDDFADTYADMLRYSGSKSLEGMLKPFGLDIEDYFFWHEALDPIDDVVKEIEKLAKVEGLI